MELSSGIWNTSNNKLRFRQFGLPKTLIHACRMLQSSKHPQLNCSSQTQRSHEIGGTGTDSSRKIIARKLLPKPASSCKSTHREVLGTLITTERSGRVYQYHSYIFAFLTELMSVSIGHTADCSDFSMTLPPSSTFHPVPVCTVNALFDFRPTARQTRPGYRMDEEITIIVLTNFVPLPEHPAPVQLSSKGQHRRATVQHVQWVYGFVKTPMDVCVSWGTRRTRPQRGKTRHPSRPVPVPNEMLQHSALNECNGLGQRLLAHIEPVPKHVRFGMVWSGRRRSSSSSSKTIPAASDTDFGLHLHLFTTHPYTRVGWDGGSRNDCTCTIRWFCHPKNAQTPYAASGSLICRKCTIDNGAFLPIGHTGFGHCRAHCPDRARPAR